MRFNEKRTCLEFFQTGIPDRIFINKSNWLPERKAVFISEIQQAFKLMKHSFQKKIQYITEPFHKAIYDNRYRTLEAMQSGEKLGELSGTFILKCGDGVTKTTFYWFDEENDSPRFSCCVLSFTKSDHDDVIALDYAIVTKGDENIGGMQIRHCLTDTYTTKGINHEKILAELLLICGFLRYCRMETKVMSPKEKFRKDGVKYFNETKSNIEILDSTWFTNLVVSGAFKVRGHLRLQPKKIKGEWTKEWIWVQEFEKTGYTRKAKINPEI